MQTPASGSRTRLQQKIQDLQAQYDTLSDKLQQLGQQKILETRVEEKMRLEEVIKQTEAERQRLETQLEEFERQLENGAAIPSVVQRPPSIKSGPSWVNVQRRIVQFLTSLNIHDSAAQRAFIATAALDDALVSQITFSGPAVQFFQLLLPLLRSYGRLADDRDPLVAVLEAAKILVGPNRQAECDDLIGELESL
jgi:hypothetical protein